MSQSEDHHKVSHNRENNSDHSRSVLPKEEHQLVKRPRPSKVTPMGIDMNDTLDKTSIMMTKSNRVRTLVEKLSSFNSSKMITENSTRETFVRNIFLILSLQSTMTMVVIAIVISVDELRESFSEASKIPIACGITMAIIGVFLLLFKSTAKKRPINYILFAGFSICKSLIGAYICSYYMSPAPLAAFVMFAGINSCLALYTSKSKDNFTTKRAILTAFGACTLFFALSLSFSYMIYKSIIYIYIAMIPFSWFVAYDVQLMTGGRFSEYTFDDYLAASQIVYVEIVGIFFYILYLLKRLGG
ncbi:hypothetical protein SteCoe_5761 [Stentor coeruleus]|uniref:Uncharacterized protein n=1 Tax=Stentor coeruleus TaxID=5963 RepID=A0A1R2CRI3_9CILI|nr:hypothetical protein SteCoe_5761 [Stentor coeruleus]